MKQKQKFGQIDILFNNAGICAYGLVDEMPEEEWDAMIDINLKGSLAGSPPDHSVDERKKRQALLSIILLLQDCVA